VAELDLRTKIQLIREGVEYENLNEVGAVLAGVGILAALATTIGFNISDAKKKKEANESEKKKDADRAEKRRKHDEWIGKNSKEKLVQNIKTDIKKMVAKLKADPKIKKEIEKDLKNADSDHYKLIFKDNGDHVQIIEGDQEVMGLLRWVLRDIKKVIDLKYAEPIGLGVTHITTGDGDEGSIHISV